MKTLMSIELVLHEHQGLVTVSTITCRDHNNEWPNLFKQTHRRCPLISQYFVSQNQTTSLTIKASGIMGSTW